MCPKQEILNPNKKLKTVGNVKLRVDKDVRLSKAQGLDSNGQGQLEEW